jgi:spermidine synthase
MTYFEIDPLIEKVARNPKYFTFLRDTKATLDVVIGDARLSLARQPDGEFDFIVLDAFSSDAIPVHLLTQEALAMYTKKLKPGGFIAYHISNRYLNLEPVVANNAAAMGWKAWSQVDGPSVEEADAGKTASSYMVVAKDEKSLSWILGRMTMWGASDPDKSIRPWTDDYSNVLGVFSLNN